jgi:hypothetical protein
MALPNTAGRFGGFPGVTAGLAPSARRGGTTASPGEDAEADTVPVGAGGSATVTEGTSEDTCSCCAAAVAEDAAALVGDPDTVTSPMAAAAAAARASAALCSAALAARARAIS